MNICKFNTSAPAPDTLYTLNFVYETEQQRMSLIHSNTTHRMHLVTEGSGRLHTVYGDFAVKAGDIFFTFASTQYSLEAIADLKYMYVSFLGIRANMLFEQFKITQRSCVITGCGEAVEIWERFLTQSDAGNIDLNSEAALLYAFAVIEKQVCGAAVSEQYREKILLIKKYVDENYCDSSLTIGKIAADFSYSQKYISEVFKKEFGLSLQQYITLLRIQNACSLMEKGFSCIGDISKLCGFSDPLYFSKVFKKKSGLSPKEYIKQASASQIWREQ